MVAVTGTQAVHCGCPWKRERKLQCLEVWLSALTSWQDLSALVSSPPMRGSCLGVSFSSKLSNIMKVPESKTKAVIFNWGDSGHWGHWQGLEPFWAVTTG